MSRVFNRCGGALSAAGVFLAACPSLAVDLSMLMPQPGDYGERWWRQGFPGVVEGVPWERSTRTGRYGFVFNTESMTFRHLGAMAPSGRLGDLPPAALRLRMDVDGKTYECRQGGAWSRFSGPRLIEAGRFLQREDVTGLVFSAEDGTPLNVQARFETVAWPDCLGMVLHARPGLKPLSAGEDSFGRVRGGYGLDASCRFDIPAAEADLTERFTLEFWVYVPVEYKAGEHSPWLVCKNGNELADGNVGLLVHSEGVLDARWNVGGGRENAHSVRAERRHALRIGQWNHVALSSDESLFRLYVNGQWALEERMEPAWAPAPGGLTFGGRGDRSGDGYPFHGVVDEIRLYDRALTLEELRWHHNRPEVARPTLKPVREWTFRADGIASMQPLSERWKSAAMEVTLQVHGKPPLTGRWALTGGDAEWTNEDAHQAALWLDPKAMTAAELESPVRVSAMEAATSAVRDVVFEPNAGWHRVDLNGIAPVPPAGGANPSNDAVERVKLVLENPTALAQVARLMFDKGPRGIQQRIGTPITGITAVLRDADGFPTGIPVQLSKNWHTHPEGGDHSGQWFHGISLVRLPPNAKVNLELVLAYGHWGGVPAASHAQLSLIGWGGNQLWEQAAVGSWGESICFEPEQIQRGCTITDVRPLMVRSKNENTPEWGWTNNVGGGDFWVIEDLEGARRPNVGMRTDYLRSGPCLTETGYAGGLHGLGVRHRTTVSLSRRDDFVCATYRLRMDVTEVVPFSRFVIFQTGADNYACTREKKLAVGNENGLVREWDAQWGGDLVRGAPIELNGTAPWASLHATEGNADSSESGAWANRGIVIREWKARLGGKEVRPWMQERGLDRGRAADTSILELVPPPDVKRLEPGDHIEAVIEHLILPQHADDYYGPNDAFRTALAEDADTWRMAQRHAAQGDVKVEMKRGRLLRRFPDVRIASEDGAAACVLSGGSRWVTITFTGLRSHREGVLMVDGKPLDQSVHGSDFWQTDFDPATRTWSRSYNLPALAVPRAVTFFKQP